MKRATVIILIACMVLSAFSVCFAVPADIGSGVVPIDPGGNYPQYDEITSLGSKVTVEVTLKEDGILFTITDTKTGQPIVGATVKERLDGTQEWILVPGVTNAEGNLFRVMPSYADEKIYHYIISAAGYSDSEEVTVSFREGSVTKQIALTRIATPAEFYVTNDLGRPVPNARIGIKSNVNARSTTQTEEECVTDANGYVKCDLADGEYSYSVTENMHEDAVGQMSISHLQEDRHVENVTVSRKLFQVSFYVYGEKGLLENAVVSMNGQGVRTDKGGRAAIIETYAGTYNYRVECADYEIFEGQLTVPSTGDTCVVQLTKIRQPEPTPTAQPTESTLPTQNPLPTESPRITQSFSSAVSPLPGVTMPPEKPETDNTPVNVVIYVKYTDGSPAAGMDMELHSRVLFGKTDANGTELFENVEMGNHTVYVKKEEKTLAKDSFMLSRSDLTTLNVADGQTGILVRINVTSIIIELTMDKETGSCGVTAVREGYRENMGSDGAALVIGATDDPLGPSGGMCAFLGKPFCLTKILFGQEGIFCGLLGISCWVWTASIAVVIAFGTWIGIWLYRKRREEKKPIVPQPILLLHPTEDKNSHG